MNLFDTSFEPYNVKKKKQKRAEENRNLETPLL